MTSRERILKTLNHEQTDRLAFTPCVDGYYLSSLPESKTVIEGMRDMGADIMARHVHVYGEGMTLVESREDERGLYTHHQDRSGNLQIIRTAPPVGEKGGPNGNMWLSRLGRSTERIITPYGELTAAWNRTEMSPYIPFCTEHVLKSIDDIKAYQYYYEHLEYQTCYDAFEKTDREIGDAGIATATGPSSPFHLMLDLFGMEEFYYTLMDYPDEIEALMDVMHEKHKQIYKELIASSPAKIVIAYENTSATTQSPDMYEKYCMRQLDDYAEIAQAAGKKLLVHMCGTLKEMKHHIARGKMDGIVDIAPSPTGNVSLVEAKKYWGGDKIVMGGIDATAFRNYTAQEMEAYVREQLRQLGDYTGVFMGTGDALPQGAKMENLLAISNVLRHG